MTERFCSVKDLAALVEQLERCLAYADREQDHVLAALISAAYEMAVGRLAGSATTG